LQKTERFSSARNPLLNYIVYLTSGRVRVAVCGEIGPVYVGHLCSVGYYKDEHTTERTHW